MQDITECKQTEEQLVRYRDALQQLVREQDALRRVATLVARASSEEEIFARVTEEAGRLLGVDVAALGRYDAGRETLIAVWSARGGLDGLGRATPLGGNNVATIVFESERSARMDDYSDATGEIAALRRTWGVRAIVGAPIPVEGEIRGVMYAASTSDRALPADAEERLASFTELLAAAYANAEARTALRRVADEQAALRRVAMLVAEGGAPTAVFDAVAAEMERLLDADGVTLGRYEPGDEVTVVAHRRGPDAQSMPPGTRISHAGENVTTVVRRTERPARIDYGATMPGVIADMTRGRGIRAGIGAPIVVEGRLWGVISAAWSSDELPPADMEDRMAQFAQLLGTAIANADGRDQLNASRARLLAAGDEARRRVVRDLHDGAQQRLVTASMMLKGAQQAIRADINEGESLVGAALDQVGQANEELRELAHGLHPAALARGGVRTGVKAVVDRLNLPVHMDIPDERFHPEIESSAYFIVVEALTNVVKHAQATRAEIRVFVEGEALCLMIRDDGIGGADPSGHGLTGLRDRASAIGGRLEIDSEAQNGTLLTAMLPLSLG